MLKKKLAPNVHMSVGRWIEGAKFYPNGTLRRYRYLPKIAYGRVGYLFSVGVDRLVKGCTADVIHCVDVHPWGPEL